MRIQKKYFSKVFLSLFAATVMFTACTEEEQIELIQENNQYAQVTSEGILKFDDFTDLNALLEEFKEDETFKRNFFESKVEFTSLWNLYKSLSEKDELKIINNPEAYKHIVKLQEIDGEVYAEFILDDSDLGSLLNHRGELIVGNKKYIFKADNAEVYSIDEFLQTSRSNPEIIPIYRSYSSINAMNEERRPDCDSDYKRGRRFKGSLWTLHIGPIYSGIGVSTTHYRRRGGIWWRQKTDELSLKYDVTFTQTISGISYTDSEDWDSGIESNVRRVSTVFERCINTNCQWMFDSAESYHYGKNGSDTWNCSLDI